MNLKSSLTLRAGLLAVLLTPLHAQHHHDAPQILLVIRENVPMAHQQPYEAAVKQLIAAMVEHQVGVDGVRFSAVSGPEFGYAYLVPMNGFAGMDAFNQNWKAAEKQIGAEKFSKLLKKTDSHVVGRDIYHVIPRPDLSHSPPEPRLKAGETRFVRYLHYYPLADLQAEFEELAKEYVALYKKHAVTSGFQVYQALTGAELPLYVLVEGGKSRADYHANAAEVAAKLGDEGEALARRARATLRRVEAKSGSPRSDLSYPPPHQ